MSETEPAGKNYMAWWTDEQFAYFCKVRERFRPKLVDRGVSQDDIEHELDVAAIHEMQEHGVLR